MRGKRLGLLVILASTFALLAVACGGDDPTPTPRPTPTSPPVGVPTPTPDPFTAEWDALLTAAQAEGELITFLCCALGARIGPFIGAWEDEFGIKWVSSTGSSRQQWEKVQAERAAGQFTLDVWTGGLRTSNTRLLPGGALRPIKSLLFHPEVTDESLWFGGEHFYGDNRPEDAQDKVFVYGGSASGAEITYNTDLLDPADITSYDDLLDPIYKGKIIARDPRLAGTSQSTALFYLLMGEEWLRRLLTEQDIVFTDDARQAAEQLALGQYTICLFACGQEVQEAREDGLPVQENFPGAVSEGARVSTGGNTLMAIDGAPHPAAQKLFINWFLSKEGQTLYQRVTNDASLREDISTDDVDEGNRREAGKTYLLFERDPNFQTDLEYAVNIAIDVLGGPGGSG
ncbi:MAG: extracellular solute-binding protein [Dehalococcoidia bacterium]